MRKFLPLLLLLPLSLFAQNGQSGFSTPFLTTQIGGYDPSGLLKAFKVDANGVLSVDLGSGGVSVSNFPSSFSISNFPSFPSGFNVTNTPHVIVDTLPSTSGVVADPCQDVGTLKQSASKAVSASSTLELIPLTAGQTIFPCGYLYNQLLAGTFKFVTGTGTNCGTGQTDVTVAFGTVANQPYSYVPAMTALTIPVGQALCATTTGLTAPASVQLTFAKK